MSSRVVAPTSRTAPCPCGSGKRYKHCHGSSSWSYHTGDGGASNPLIDPYVVLNRALEAQRNNQLDVAEGLYREGLAIAPSNFDALHMLGVVLMSQGRSIEAIELLQRAHAIEPTNSAVLHNLGLASANRCAEIQLPSSFAAIEAAASLRTYPDDPVIAPDDVRVIAYYLPQFHRIPENDTWWGEGFTEWVNVARARPNYEGHYQPHLPGELGAYDLLGDEGIVQRQAALAREYGVHGFAYYHYWFGGKRLLEQPLERVLRSRQPDFPFCVFWANESWSKRWDGGNHEVLMPQTHDAADDRAFIEHLLPYFADPRYIRVHGRPLLMVYRVELFPSARATVKIWHDVCRAHGFLPPYLVKADTGSSDPPERYGFDASVEFPPHRLRKVRSARGLVPGVDRNFRGSLFDMRDVISQFACAEEPLHRHFQCIAPAWDNTARKQHDGTMVVGETPPLFRAWARNAIARSAQQHPPGERLVFVNAWNEWAEGAHLEPCQKFGRAWLEALLEARSVPRDFRTIAQISDALQLDAFSRMDGQVQSCEQLTLLSGLHRRKGDLQQALAAIGAACKAAAVATPSLLKEVTATVDLLADRIPAEACNSVNAVRQRRADQRKAQPLPLVSILIPSYGHARYVTQALESALNQTYPNIEIIIIDDGSKDDSVRVIRDAIAGAKRPVRFIARENRGAHSTINEAATLANGDYINVLNSDDEFCVDRIERCISAIHHGGALWGYSRTEFINEDSEPLGEMDPRTRPLHESIHRASMARRQSEAHVRYRSNPAISTGNLFVERTFFASLGGFADLRYVHDWEFCLRAFLLEEPVWIDTSLYRYRFHGRNTILENESAASRESDKILKQYYDNASSPVNPVAWSLRVDGIAFLAHRTIVAGCDANSLRTLASLLDQYRNAKWPQ